MPIYKIPSTLYMYGITGPGWVSDEVDFALDGSEMMGEQGTAKLMLDVNPADQNATKGSQVMHGLEISISLPQAEVYRDHVEAKLIDRDSGAVTELEPQIEDDYVCWLAGAEAVVKRRQAVLLAVPFLRKQPGMVLANFSVEADELTESVKVVQGYTIAKPGKLSYGALQTTNIEYEQKKG